MKISRTVSAVAVLSSTLALAGCVMNKTPDPNPRSDGITFTLLDEEIPGEPQFQANWEYNTESSIWLYLYGSSSCPPVVEDVVQEEDTLTVKMRDYSDQACTSDWGGPKVWELKPVPSDVEEIILVGENENPGKLPKKNGK